MLEEILKKLIFSFGVGTIYTKIARTCPVCNLARPKQIRKIVGRQRTNSYLPDENLIIDSAYLPNSTSGFKEFKENLESSLAYLNTALEAVSPYHRGKSSMAESSIRLLKRALRKTCLYSPAPVINSPSF